MIIKKLIQIKSFSNKKVAKASACHVGLKIIKIKEPCGILETNCQTSLLYMDLVMEILHMVNYYNQTS